MTASLISAVVIGRNEGARLPQSLRSVQEAHLPLVYADSGSTDGSPEWADDKGVVVVRLDPSRPFSAARGRNEGFAALRRLWPDTKYVQFLDGDCVLEKAFPAAAVRKLESDPNCAIVTGHLFEQSPQSSIYKRMCAIEWQGRAGTISDWNDLGGIMVVRVSAFEDVSGFNENAIAGEEADLGVRLGTLGFSAIKLDLPMATHNAEMHHFEQWWRRAVRNGHSLAHRYFSHRSTQSKDGQRGIRSALFWGFALPAAVLLSFWLSRGVSAVLLLGYPLLAWRIYRHYRRDGQRSADSRLMAGFLIIAKFAEFLGILGYLMNRARGRYQIIEWR